MTLMVIINNELTLDIRLFMKIMHPLNLLEKSPKKMCALIGLKVCLDYELEISVM